MNGRIPVILYVTPILLMIGVFTAGLLTQAYAEVLN
jgi:hypothetical protein